MSPDYRLVDDDLAEGEWKTARAMGGYNHHAVQADRLKRDGRNARAACGFRPSSPNSGLLRPRHGWEVRLTANPVAACMACLAKAPDAWPNAAQILEGWAEKATFAGNRAAAACRLKVVLGSAPERPSS